MSTAEYPDMMLAETPYSRRPDGDNTPLGSILFVLRGALSFPKDLFHPCTRAHDAEDLGRTLVAGDLQRLFSYRMVPAGGVIMRIGGRS